MANKKLSPSGSWFGFKVSKNLKSAIKNSLFVLLPAILAELATNNIITASVSGFLGTIILKALEFYFREVDL